MSTSLPAAGHNSRRMTYPEMLAEKLSAVQAAQSAHDILHHRQELMAFIIRSFDHLIPSQHNRSYHIHLQLAADIVAQDWHKAKHPDHVMRAICFVLENHTDTQACTTHLLPTAVQLIRDLADPADQFHAIDMLMQTTPPEPIAQELSALWDHVAESVPGFHHGPIPLVPNAPQPINHKIAAHLSPTSIPTKSNQSHPF